MKKGKILTNQEMIQFNFAMQGKQVRKKSGKPFKSGEKVNTVMFIILHPVEACKDRYAYTFDEDDSYVAVSQCVLTNL